MPKLLTSLIPAIAFLLTACGESRRPESGGGAASAGRAGERAAKVRIGVSTANTTDPMTLTRSLILEHFIRQRPGMVPAFVDAEDNPARQAEQIRTFIAQKPDFLVVFPEDVSAISSALAAAVSSGIRVIVVDRDLPPDLCTTSVFVDEHKLGEMAGRFIVEALTKKALDEGAPAPQGRIVEITGPAGAWVTRQRTEGFQQALTQSKQQDIRIVHIAPGDWDPKATRERIGEALRLQKPFDVIFAQDDYMALAAHKAILEFDAPQREKILILGVDGSIVKDGGLEMVAHSELDATIFNPLLVDLTWEIIKAYLDRPGFVPKPRYEQEPSIVTLDKASTLLRQGIPVPKP